MIYTINLDLVDLIILTLCFIIIGYAIKSSSYLKGLKQGWKDNNELINEYQLLIEKMLKKPAEQYKKQKEE